MSIQQADIAYRSQLLLPLQYYFEKAKFFVQPTMSQLEQLRTVLAQWQAWQTGDEARLVRELVRVDSLDMQMQRASSRKHQLHEPNAQLAAKRKLESASWKNDDAVFASWVASYE